MNPLTQRRIPPLWQSTAFLAVDSEEQYLPEGDPLGLKIGRFFQTIENAGLYTVHIAHDTKQRPKQYSGTLCRAGEYETWTGQSLREIFCNTVLQPHHRVMMKSYPSPFHQTDFAHRLRIQGIKAVVIAGVMAEQDSPYYFWPPEQRKAYGLIEDGRLCIDYTIEDALNAGFNVILINDLVSPTPDRPNAPPIKDRYPEIIEMDSWEMLRELGLDASKPLDHHQAQEIVVGPQVAESELLPVIR